MRKLLTTGAVSILVASATVVSAAQDGDARGSAERRDYPLQAFDEISMIGPHHVVVSVGPGHSVSAEGPRETLERTEVVVENGELKIQPKDDDWWRQRRENDSYQPATYRVTLPRLAAASLAGSGDMRVDRVEGPRFAGSVAGSGGLDVAALQVDDARLSVAGSGELIARGGARQSQVSIAGSGNLRAREMTSESASVSVAGSGNAELTVMDTARVSIVGSGDVDIAGTARCSVSRIGSGQARCAGGSGERAS